MPSKIRNPLGWRRRLARLRGSTIEYDLSSYDAPLAAIERLDAGLREPSDADLDRRWRALTDRAQNGDAPDDLLVPAYALVREAARRTLGLHPYEEQIAAAVALHRGRVVEMLTGEGKTLAAVMPACLAALFGKTHVLTFNDYLAFRDAEWMGPVYRFLGLRAAHVGEGMDAARRRRAYSADVTYVTAKEAGFDLLRDRLATNPRQQVHRPFYFAIVDEADSLLIDEARVPLVIAGATKREDSSADRVATIIEELAEGRDFEVSENRRDVELTETGLDRIEARLEQRSLLAAENHQLLGEIHCALYARTVLERDVDYLVRRGRLELIDEFTGRVVADRQWPDGLQAALEAKEGLADGRGGRVLGSLTLQHFFALYPHLCGMSGTARGAAREIHDFYGLGVTVIPTHRPVARIDRPDLVFTHREAKERTVIDEVCRAHAVGRPVLVGTATVEESERLAARLEKAGVPHAVLNAKNDDQEAAIVANAGALGSVTIATNMAGRGTDVRLGGEHEEERRRVVELGGLLVIGTERHESRRVDLQLRGRAGRQGDPGESRFLLALDDDLPVRFGLRELLPPRLAPERSSEPLESAVLAHEMARIQRVAEGQSREVRKVLCEYAEPLEEQQRIIHDWRQALLVGERRPEVWSREPRWRELLAITSEEALCRAEVTVTLAEIDRAWSEHLARAEEMREGIHLVQLGGEDAPTRFRLDTAKAFRQMLEDVESAVCKSLSKIEARDGEIDLGALEICPPSSTWTYQVHDDPFRDQLGTMLTGPGKTTLAIGAALNAPLFLLLWLIVERFFRRRPSAAREPHR